MDKRLTAEILKTCESIGFAGEDKYIAHPEWEVCMKDLILYLRRDDDDHSARRLLGQAQVLGRDLLPLFKYNHKEPKLWDLGLRLLVNLTHPALLLYDEEVPKNKKYLNYYNQLLGYLRTYKEDFVDKVVWKILAEKLRQLLNLEWDKRMEHDRITIERILIVIRNILHVPADPSEERRADDDTSLHDRILMVMHISGFEDLLLYAAVSETTQEFSVLILEIMSWMLREQTGEQLAKTQLARNEDDKIKDERELVRMREKEAVLKTIQLQKLPTRHSRFGGTFVVRDMKAPSGRDLLCHKPITSVTDLSLDSTKKRKRVASNRKPINDEDSTRRSTIPIRIILKDFCTSFLVDGTYNQMMSFVKDGIVRGRTEDNDETYYLWGMKFFMEFNRHHQFSVSYVSETMSTSTFHYVQTLLDRYQGMMVTDKEKIPFWSRRAHMALKAYQELLFSLLWMDRDEDESVKESSRVIKSNVFYLPEYRELCHGLLNTYDPVKLSKLYLKDLIETNHLFLKMLEDYSSQNRRIMIKGKGKRKKSTKGSKKKKKARRGASGATMNSSDLEEAWAIVSGEISSSFLSSELPDGETGEEIASTNVNVIPFDAASDVPIDEQKETAVERIAVFLHTGKFKEAVLLLRASREVWPNNPEYFGEVDCEPLDEVEVLKSIYMEKASLPAVTQARISLRNGLDGGDTESRAGSPIAEDDQERAAVIGEEERDEEEEDEDEEENEEDTRAIEQEQEFDFRGFVLKYAMAKVVCNYALLLQDWDTLKPLTLHCIVKMFHRFVFDMGYPALICQASLFLTFKKILEVADLRSDLKEVKTFFLHFWPKFVKLCEDKKMFIEILFWKTAREAQEIQDGYSDLRGPSGGASNKKSNWTSEEENELELLVELYNDAPEEVKKAQKLVDFIMERWTWRPKSKRLFMLKLVEKELVNPETVAKKARPPKTWGDEEIEKLRELYEEHKDSDDVMGSILENMLIKRSKKSVIDKMIEIQLITDKSAVKKRSKRSKKHFPSRSRVSTRSDSDDENENNNGEQERSQQRSERPQSSGESSDSDSESSDSESNDENDKDNSTRLEISSNRVYDDEKVFDLGRKLMANDMMAAIRWIKQSLTYYLEDIMEDPDSDESVPLVPIGSECITAMSSSDFKIWLNNMGLYPPGAQEAYWRIPPELRKKDIELRLETLSKILATDQTATPAAAVAATASTEREKSPITSTPVEDDSDSSDGRISDDDLVEDVDTSAFTKLDDSDLEDLEGDVKENDVGVGVVKKKRAFVIESDSDDE